MDSNEILRRMEAGMKESNKFLIQELIYDLETTGIGPVISADGEVIHIKLADGIFSQMCNQALKKFNLNPSDFCLLEEDGKNKKSVWNAYLIHRTSTRLKNYKVSNNTWTKDLYRDLENNFFN